MISAGEPNRSAAPDCSTTVRRGLTLLEILIAVGIIVAIGAILVPATLNQLEERAFRHAIDSVSGHLLLARAHAQQTGRAVEVIYHHDREPPLLIARYFDADGGAQQSRGEQFAELNARSAEPSSREVVRSWARRTLPDSVILMIERPAFLEAVGGPTAERDFAEGDLFDEPPGFLRRETETDVQPIRLGVFLSDGSAVFTRSVWVSDQRERAASLRINTWTGEAIVREPRRGIERGGAGDGREQR